MKKTLLCGALLGALGCATSALAADYDDRWYLSAGAGIVNFDSQRNVDSQWSGHLGFGRFFAPRWSWDAELMHVNPQNEDADLNWSLASFSLTGRYHLRDEGDSWWPYLAFGAGTQRHWQELAAFDDQGPRERTGNELAAMFGAGLMADYGKVAARLEAGYRMDFDGDIVNNDDSFKDMGVSLSLLVKLGEAEEAVEPTEPTPPPAPPAKTCADMDDDGDGVNNCEDKCPNSQAGQAVGKDGCPVPLTIDLRGVNFDFDKATLRPDAIAILDEATGILKKYPELKVEVAGHTDLCGTDAYNQKLSQSRAQAVYDYLTGKGIAASRLIGPNGFGESRPLEQTAQTLPACKSERNRRTELNVQN